ncbi:polysaccharide deacetylase family protein [Halomarina ordinaria]|uniref:Polysaccharide deacetylase family protein n=1 Tax=Halomarina ordinaria TaxID=3033939 RepID=A0ABD5UBJ1_9EURY|nr:polysaccharide deacetylase family protein [Halomarina sp. PSRA2]
MSSDAGRGVPVGGEEAVAAPMDDDHPYHVCLSHDVDRTRKTLQGLYYALVERRPYHVRSLLDGSNPYWQFETITSLEADLGVRSTFFFLQEQRLLRDRPRREWVVPRNWKLYCGRYDVTSSAVRTVVESLDCEGWDVGLHGSFESYDDPRRLATEKATLERVLSKRVRGARQHHLNLDRPTTWEYQRRAGLRYDSTLGSNHVVGFQHGYHPIRPFDDDFVVFPITVMDAPLMAESDGVAEAWVTCAALVEEARANGAVLTLDWHQRVFDDREFPGYRQLYRKLIRTAQADGAWVGSCGELYEKLQEDRP